MADLSAQEKRERLAALLQKKKDAQAAPAPQSAGPSPISATALAKFSLRDGIKNLKEQQDWLKTIKQPNPYFRELSGAPTPQTDSHGHDVINFACYNYIGMSGDADVSAAAKEAIDTFGTSVGASRIASGERTLHRQLEKEMAAFLGYDDALCFVGGFGTNESVIGHICKPGDMIVYDSLIHRSCLDGAHLSGARQVPFTHNDLDALEKQLERYRSSHKECLIVVEGLYSMDGDSVDLKRVVELKKKYDALLFVDEAHSIGVMGQTGRGIAEHCGVAPTDIDFWMCTLSKTFGSCGGIIAGAQDVIEYLRYTTPGFLYSVGMSPANAAAALKSLQKLASEPERVARVQENSRHFWQLCQDAGLNTGPSEGFCVVPVILGNSEKAMSVSNALFERGINAQPILFPAVPENEARIRFFITSEHTKDQIERSVQTIKELVA